jgi:hypothetical protein
LPNGATFDILTRKYSFTGLSKAGVYTFSMMGSVTGVKPATVTFTVTVTTLIATISSPIIAINTEPPYFSPKLADLTLALGKTQAFKFPPMIDPDKGDTGMFVSMNLGSASSFVTGSFPNLMIAPKRDPLDVGSFPISITIKDNNKLSLTATYSFNIIVTGVISTPSG